MRVWLVRAALLAFVACGGKTASDALDGGGTDSSRALEDAGSPDVRTHPRPEDASVPDTHVCAHGGGGGSGGPGSCGVFDEEVCDGVAYQVSCSCPEGVCKCSGSTGGLVPFKGCPSCPSASAAYEACGFPQ
jgi:hypothetical protein